MQVRPLERPTLILAGRQDATVGYQDTGAILENYLRATFPPLDCAGRNLQIEQEALFDAPVHDRLDRVEQD